MITYFENRTDFDYGDVLKLYENNLPERSDLSKEEIKKAFEGSTYTLTAYEGESLVGAVRVLSDNLEWTLITDLVVEKEYRNKGVGTALVQRVLDKFKGHEIFTYTHKDNVGFYENRGFFRSKNAFTYAGTDGDFLTGLPKEEFYLPVGYRYENEFHPFVGAFPVGRKSSFNLLPGDIEYTKTLKNLDITPINALLEKAFGKEKRDIEVTKKAFTTSRVYAFAYAKESIVGCARAVSDGVSQALILNVAVDPDYQGLHIGQGVVDLLASQLKGQNIFLNTHPGGVGFYNRKPYLRNKTALLYPAHPDMPEEIAKGFILPKGYRFEDEF